MLKRRVPHLSLSLGDMDAEEQLQKAKAEAERAEKEAEADQAAEAAADRDEDENGVGGTASKTQQKVDKGRLCVGVEVEYCAEGDEDGTFSRKGIITAIVEKTIDDDVDKKDGKNAVVVEALMLMTSRRQQFFCTCSALATVDPAAEIRTAQDVNTKQNTKHLLLLTMMVLKRRRLNDIIPVAFGRSGKGIRS